MQNIALLSIQQSLSPRYTLVLLYKSAITAPTTPSNPAPTFTAAAPLFPLVVVAAAALPVAVPVLLDPVVLVPVVFALLLLPVVVVVFALSLVLALVEPEEEEMETEVDGAADETVLVESIENSFE